MSYEEMSEEEIERRLDEAVEAFKRGDYIKYTRNYDPDRPTVGATGRAYPRDERDEKLNKELNKDCMAGVGCG